MTDQSSTKPRGHKYEKSVMPQKVCKPDDPFGSHGFTTKPHNPACISKPNPALIRRQIQSYIDNEDANPLHYTPPTQPLPPGMSRTADLSDSVDSWLSCTTGDACNGIGPKHCRSPAAKSLSNLLTASNFESLEALVSCSAQQYSTNYKVSFTDTGEDVKAFEEVERMVQEENADVEFAKRMLDSEKRKVRASVSSVSQDLRTKKKIAFAQHRHLKRLAMLPEEDLMQPEVAAAMMHSEEQGLKMKSPPAEIFAHLFPLEPGETTVSVSSAAHPIKDVVVPLKGMVLSDLDDAAMLDAQRRMLIESVSNQAFGRQRAATNLTELVGYMDQILTTVDFELVSKPPQYCNFIQLRGSVSPSWFPGYFVSLPDTLRGVDNLRQPWDVLDRAWRVVQPTALNLQNGVIVV